MNKNSFSSVLKIITVDDSPVVAERLQLMLSEVDNIFFLGNAATMEEALELILLDEPNVAILDINLKDSMLVSNGIHLLIHLRRSYPKMKIIMLTNLSGPQYQNTCTALGADYFFDKSNDFEKIPETLREIFLQHCRTNTTNDVC